ncbi:hypothetical protein ACWDE0_00675 [Streptomyces sp. 900105755]
MLAEVLRQLPPRSRARPARQVRALDAGYAERTPPDPFAADRQWRSDLWWRRRPTGGPG